MTPLIIELAQLNELLLQVEEREIPHLLILHNHHVNFFIIRRLIPDIVKHQIGQISFLVAGHGGEHGNHVFSGVVWDLVFGAGAQDVARLVMSLIIHFPTTRHHITQQIMDKIRIKLLPHHIHELNLTNRSNHTQMQKLIIRVLHKVAAAQVALRYVDNTNCD